MEDTIDLLDFMTQDSINLVQIPRVAQEVLPYLFEQLPIFEEISEKMLTGFHDLQANGTFNDETGYAVIERLEAEYGKEFELFPIHPEDHERISVVDEFKRDYPDKEIIEFRPSEDDDEPPEGRITWGAK
jgi:hypothetical protein